MKCIIIDDEKFAREVLSVMILKSPDLILVDEFSNAIEAMKFLNNDNKVDVIFLDVHMPDFSGFDFIKTIKNPPQIVLVTSDKNFAIEAFNYDCISDYLVKPILQDRFERAIDRVKVKLEEVIKSEVHNNLINKEIYVNIDKRLIKIDIMSINFIHANGDYIIIKQMPKIIRFTLL